MISLSEKQEAMLAFIEEFVEQNGYPPTHEEIRQGLKISTKSLVNYHLEALENADLLVRVPNTPRGLRLRNDCISLVTSPPQVEAPVPPLNADEIVELTYDIVTNNTNLYALKVQEDGLTDTFVGNGDIVILQRQPWVNNGDLAAVRLLQEGQTTFKRYYRENGHVRLEPVTEKLKPMILAPEAVEVQGKVLAVIRQGEAAALNPLQATG